MGKRINIANNDVGKITKHLFQRLFLYNRWVLATGKKGDKGFKIIHPPAERFWADPFIVKYDGRLYVFFEEFIYRELKGHIVVGELNIKRGIIEKIIVVLQDKHHFSYPHVFRYENDWYMIPETHEKEEIGLYMATEFPYKWKKKRVLIKNIDSADSTIFKWDGIFYLFTNPREDDIGMSHYNNLKIYYSSDLHNGEFLPVPDIQLQYNGLFNSRMAGSIISCKDGIFRLAQNCERIYGESVQVNRIDLISPQKYRESFIKTIDRPRKALGMHTYNAVGNTEIVDLYIREYNPLKIFRYKCEMFAVKMRERVGT